MSDAFIAFLLHGPGLRFLRGYRMPTQLFVVNVIAIALTFTLAGAAFFVAGNGALAVAIWLSGHFGWSAFLAFYVSRSRS